MSIAHTQFAYAGALALRSMCVLYIAVSTISVLPFCELNQAFARLPIPRSVAGFIVQLINQTMMLLEETGRIVEVLQLRGISGVKGLHVVRSFPVVWMIRILFRAERLAAAMSVRGYGIENATLRENRKLTYADTGAIFATALVLIISIIIRMNEYQ
jgi:energy-coupling factor transporter transmembrane protein EcfT